MTRFFRSAPARFTVAPLAVVLAFAACDDSTSIDDHADAEGISITVDGTEAYTYHLDDGEPATFTLEEGTYDVEITFLDHDDEPLPQDDEETDGNPVVSSTNLGVLTWTLNPGEGDPTVVDVHGTLAAVEAGTATLIVCLPHGSHCDFDAEIPVTVTAAAQ